MLQGLPAHYAVPLFAEWHRILACRPLATVSSPLRRWPAHLAFPAIRLCAAQHESLRPAAEGDMDRHRLALAAVAGQARWQSTFSGETLSIT